MNSETINNWHKELLKSFKVRDQKELAEKFRILEFEGLGFNALETNKTFYQIASFPMKVNLLRLKKKGKTDEGLEVLSFGTEVYKLTDQGLQINLSLIQQAGGNAVTELETLLVCLHRFLESKPDMSKVTILLALDSNLFYQIAKLRAARIILETINNDISNFSFKLIATPSLSQATAFEATTQMLRNTAAISAGLMGGADEIALDNYINPDDETFWRQTRNVFHVLREEANLSRVKDPAFGSELIESLTTYLVDESYGLFKKNIEFSFEENLQRISKECEDTFLRKRELVETRKSIIVGVNNYCNVEENLDEFPQYYHHDLFPLRQPTERIEKLRYSYQSTTISPIIYSFGDLKKVFDRVMFAKNFFEVTGKEVHHIHRDEFDAEVGVESHIIICAEDGDYESILNQFKTSGKPVFIVSREIQQTEAKNIYQGLNIVEFFNENFGSSKVAQ